MKVKSNKKFREGLPRIMGPLTGLGFVLAVGLMGGCQTPPVDAGPVVVDVRELPPGVGEVYRRLVGGGVGLAERTQAAATLLRIDDPAAERALAAGLNPEQPAAVRQAVLLAVATDPADPPGDLWRPMLRLLEQDAGEDAAAVVPALGRFDRDELWERLEQTAESDTLPTPRRVRAIGALAHRRTQEVAGRLVELTGMTQPADVQSAAYRSLATLTAIDRFGQDRGRWQAWWDQNRRLSELEWNRALVRNFARQIAAGRATDQQLAQKLQEAERALYQASSPEDQAGVLAYMLQNPLPATRQLALDLAQARLVQGIAFDGPLREALRARLDDESAQVRRRAAEVLRDLNDQPAADAVARKLVDQREQVNRVLAAYLQLLAQSPRKEATEAIHALLREPGLEPDASAALAEIARAGLLTPKRSDAVLETLREDLRLGRKPSPQAIRLLGRIGRNDEWQRIEDWIDSDDDITKQAAAQAWADASDRSLAILAERAADPVIQPIVIRAATDRGQDPQTLRKLADNPPTATQFVDAWERALIAMARQPTISPVIVLDVTESLYDRLQSRGLVESLLTAALDRPQIEGDAPGPRLRLRLARAENRLARNEPELAILDFEALLREDTEALDGRERDRLYRGVVPAYLRAGRYAPALDAAGTFLRDPADPTRLDPDAIDDPLVPLILDTAKRQAELGRMVAARQLFDGLMQMLGPERDRRLPPRLAPQVNTLREMIELDSTQAGN
jgi:hypothetical protein